MWNKIFGFTKSDKFEGVLCHVPGTLALDTGSEVLILFIYYLNVVDTNPLGLNHPMFVNDVIMP